ncbi:MAG: uracil-DNA glycosylase [Candidatus Odinarchaeia archaeon]
MMKKTRLQKIAMEISMCKKCPLYLTRTNPVPGEGPVDAKIMLVGQAPGREEDLTGRPFVGRSGKLLTEALNKIELKRKNVFITSVNKCYPPKNRPPTITEINACLPFLNAQIEVIQPKLIILLGRVAVNALLNTSESLKKLHGRLIKKNNLLFLPTYHPAAILRNIYSFDEFVADLEKGFDSI